MRHSVSTISGKSAEAEGLHEVIHVAPIMICYEDANDVSKRMTQQIEHSGT